MPEAQHRDQVEQDQIAQFERAYKLRGGFGSSPSSLTSKKGMKRVTADPP